MKILEFGHLPSWAGGLQSTGGANAMFQIAFHLSKKDGVEVFFGATDVFEYRKYIEHLAVYGWNSRIILKFCLLHLSSFFSCLIYTILYRRRLPDTLGFIRRLTKCIFHVYLAKLLEPDIIHLHNDPEFYSDILYKYAKVVVTVHGVFGNDINVDSYEKHHLYEDHISKNPNISLVTFVTHSVLNEFKSTYGTVIPKHVVVLNAFDSKQFFFRDKKPSSELVLSTIASISDRKGQFRVLKGIQKARISCHYVCVGGGRENEVTKLLDFASANEINLSYLGERSPNEIREVLTQSDYMILPSSSEGFGLVYLEAMACGTPVILPNDLPIVKEIGIISSANSVLLDDCSEQAIAAILPQLADKRFDRKKVSDSVSGYSWDVITDQYLCEMKSLFS